MQGVTGVLAEGSEKIGGGDTEQLGEKETHQREWSSKSTLRSQTNLSQFPQSSYFPCSAARSLKVLLRVAP